MSEAAIRPIVLAICRSAGRLLVAGYYDPVKQALFYRPPLYPDGLPELLAEN